MKAISQEQMYLILPFKVSQLAKLIAKEQNISVIDAIRLVYKSETYKELSQEHTKLWHLGPVGLYEHFREYH